MLYHPTFKNKGFTLIELMTSVSVFLVVMTISMGSIISIFDANRKSESLKTTMDNLNFAVETMSREMRFGSHYHCTEGGVDISLPQNCSTGDSFIGFHSNDVPPKQIIYKLNGTQIEKSFDGGAFIAVTAPEITIQDLEFHVVGALPNDGLQPKVLIKIRGKAGSKTNTTSDFTVQTLVSQRQLDNN